MSKIRDSVCAALLVDLYSGPRTPSGPTVKYQTLSVCETMQPPSCLSHFGSFVLLSQLPPIFIVRAAVCLIAEKLT